MMPAQYSSRGTYRYPTPILGITFRFLKVSQARRKGFSPLVNQSAIFNASAHVKNRGTTWRITWCTTEIFYQVCAKIEELFLLTSRTFHDLHLRLGERWQVSNKDPLPIIFSNPNLDDLPFCQPGIVQNPCSSPAQFCCKYCMLGIQVSQRTKCQPAQNSPSIDDSGLAVGLLT